MQIRQRTFKCFTMQICRFFTAFWNFWRITRLSANNHCWVINAQTDPVFWPTLYNKKCNNSNTDNDDNAENSVPAALVVQKFHSENGWKQLLAKPTGKLFFTKKVEFQNFLLTFRLWLLSDNIPMW